MDGCPRLQSAASQVPSQPSARDTHASLCLRITRQQLLRTDRLGRTRLCGYQLGPSHEPKRDGLENRYPSLGGSRVQIPPPPLPEPNPMRAIELRASSPAPKAAPERAPGP